MTTEITQADEYREMMHSALLKIEDALKSTTSAASPTLAPATSAASRVRLPKLQLQSNDDVTKWSSVLESFEGAVYSNPDLTSIENFNYLNSLIEVTARAAITGLSLSL